MILLSIPPISAGYDTLKAVPAFWRNQARFVAYLEAEIPVDDLGWEIRQMSQEFADPCRRAKKPKILSHECFPQTRYSLWIDGALEITSTVPLDQWVEKYLREHDLAVFANDYFDCLYVAGAFSGDGAVVALQVEDFAAALELHSSTPIGRFQHLASVFARALENP